MQMNLANYPKFPSTYTVDFPRLAGGLNLRELDYLVDTDESPCVINLAWKNGLLQCRDGQKAVVTADMPEGDFYACYDGLFYGWAFFHVGRKLVCADMSQAATPGAVVAFKTLRQNIPTGRGTFFRYQDYLFYKNRGGFFVITYNGEDEELAVPFTSEDVQRVAEQPDNAPIIVINASPTNGSGTLYQPENRLSKLKTVRYTAVEGVTEYHLPVQYIDGVVRVKVNGTSVSNTEYTVNTSLGTVTFATAPDPGRPIVNNTVEITYSKENDVARQAVMSCTYAAVSGGDTNLCILLGGCEKQPNAVFWNSNDELAMQYYYFPVSYYNLVGDTEDAVSGFGKQYNDVIVLKERSIGKLTYQLETVDGRSTISFGYVAVNAKIGCDLPWTIQLVENNLVFCNSRQGAYIMLSSSAAYENNVQCLSQKVNDDVTPAGDSIHGLLRDIQESTTPVVSFDDDERYWLCANGKVYAWDYSVSTYAKPSWFYWTDIAPEALLQDDTGHVFHVNNKGGSNAPVKVTLFTESYSDYGAAINKVYQFPTQHLGTFERLKDVLYVLISVRSDTNSTITVQYDTDYETRVDRTPIVSSAATGRRGFVAVAKRKTGCRHVRQFGLTLRNNRPGEDLAVVSAQIMYRYQGEER